MYLADASSGSGAGSAVATIFFVIVGLGLYWLPSIIAGVRHMPHIGPTILMNLFAFAVIPWWLALMMAVRTPPRPQYVVPEGWGPQGPPPPGFGPPQGFQPPQPQAKTEEW